MKKGTKLTQDGYLLEITDLDGNGEDNAGIYRSLRQAVADASNDVPGMDSYLKVYRDFTALKGAYAAVFLDLPNESGAKPKHILVKIRSFEVYTAAGIQSELEYIERISRHEVRRPRFPSRLTS